MERAAQIAALLFAARDAMLLDTPEDLRVAFLLFDSAAETLMVRAVASEADWGRFDKNRMSWADPGSLRQIDLRDLDQRLREDPHADDPIDWTDFGALGARVNWYLSPTQKQSIDRNFDDKLRLLAWDSKIPRDIVAIASRLHVYRNEMYHREETRPNALRISAHLYALVVTQLLEALPPGWMSMGGEEDVRERVFGRLTIPSPTPDDTSWMDFGGIQRVLADDLRASLDVEDARQVIGDYIRDRVAEAHQHLAFVADFISEFDHSVPVVTELDAIRYIYAWEFGTQLADLRGRKAPVTSALLSRWDAWADGIPAQSSPLKVFESLTAFEHEFESFESKVREAASEVDAAIQAEVDRRRGK